MGTILSTILITAPLAFLAGWLVCKALFEQLRATAPRQTMPQPAPEQPQRTATQAPLTAGKADLQIMLKELATARTEKKVLANEVMALKEAIAERDHQLQDLSERLADASMPPEAIATDPNTINNIKISKEIRELQQRITNHQQQISELRHENISADKRLDGAARRFSLWRQRVRPLVKRIRQQHAIISELREELSTCDRPEQATATDQQPAATPPAVEPQQTANNLRDVRGVGPAIEKKLQAEGIYSLQQLAELSPGELTRLGKKLGVSSKQMEKNNWTRQARELLGLPVTTAEVVTGAGTAATAEA